MWTLGATRAAQAWSACARPISPPSAVTAALFDMFCGLNGRTLRPRLLNARASPATRSDLPTSEPVPCSINARAVMAGQHASSKLNSRLRLHAGGEMMLHKRHLGHEISRRDQFRLSVAASDHHMQ